jgi:ABC-type transport system substrate-binding protein
MAVDQLAAIGIEVVPRLLTPSELFSAPVIFGGPEAWQIASFSWKGAADPFLGDSAYRCEGPSPTGRGALNVTGYCNPEVDELVASTREMTDDADRVATYNEADRLYLADLAILPLYQKPSLLAWSADLSGPRLNAGATDLWNVAEWSGKDTVVVALESEPTELVPLVPPDEPTAIVRGVLYLGAFSVAPDLTYHPSLVSSAETITGSG